MEEPNFDQKLVDHLDSREWTDVQIANLLQKVGRSALLSSQGVLEVLEYQQQIDIDVVRAEEDRRLVSNHPRLPLSFYEDAEQHRTDLEALSSPDKREQ